MRGTLFVKAVPRTPEKGWNYDFAGDAFCKSCPPHPLQKLEAYNIWSRLVTHCSDFL